MSRELRMPHDDADDADELGNKGRDGESGRESLQMTYNRRVRTFSVYEMQLSFRMFKWNLKHGKRAAVAVKTFT